MIGIKAQISTTFSWIFEKAYFFTIWNVFSVFHLSETNDTNQLWNLILHLYYWCSCMIVFKVSSVGILDDSLSAAGNYPIDSNVFHTKTTTFSKNHFITNEIRLFKNIFQRFSPTVKCLYYRNINFSPLHQLS